MPDEPEVAGLLALLLLTESRRASRTRPDGSLVLLGEQDRRRWDRSLIEEGQAIVRRCLRRNQPGTYQLQAAINAVHADAATFEQTDWSQIVALYDQLLAVAPTPVVALNRAIAIGEVQGAAAALALVDELSLDNYHPFHATRADLLRRLGRTSEAAAAYERAADTGADGRRAGLPQARWPCLLLSALVTSSGWQTNISSCGSSHVRPIQSDRGSRTLRTPTTRTATPTPRRAVPTTRKLIKRSTPLKSLDGMARRGTLASEGCGFEHDSPRE